MISSAVFLCLIAEVTFKQLFCSTYLLKKGNINTARFFPMPYHEESPEKPQCNMAPPPYFALPPFSSKIFQTLPFPSILKKSNPPFMKGGSNYEGIVTISIYFLKRVFLLQFALHFVFFNKIYPILIKNPQKKQNT